MTIGYGEFIKKHRLLSGHKTQRKLALATGISHATIARIEKEIQVPEVRTLKTLSIYLTSTTYKDLMEVCGYDVDDIIDKTKEMSIDILDVSLNENINLSIDGKVLTVEELMFVAENVRMLRKFK
jgi:transcriptional regulator with XRE-family HTH domain